MKRLRAVCIITMLLGLTLSCAPHELFRVPQEHIMGQQEAKSGLEATLAQLPELSDFVVVSIRSYTTFDARGEGACYYAGAEIFLGTSLAAGEALTIYVGELQSQGWVLRDVQYEHSKILYRGTCEVIDVDTDPQGWLIETSEDYIRAKSIYPTVILVTVKFILPAREGC